MLVLSRRPGEEIVIGGHIVVTLIAIRGTRCRLGVTAPPDVSVLRRELVGKPPKPTGESSCPPQP